tara:strand:- start:438 stop:653 length:216 start_codon:yes stop_codon:yes gene_type:complete
MDNNNNNNKEMMVEMRQLLKETIELLRKLIKKQKTKQPTGYTLYRRNRRNGGKEWQALTQAEKDEKRTQYN